jgi:hypothetical protein
MAGHDGNDQALGHASLAGLVEGCDYLGAQGIQRTSNLGADGLLGVDAADIAHL